MSPTLIEDLRRELRQVIRAELCGLLEQVWEEEGGIKGQFAIIPRGAFPSEITPALLRECAVEVAKEISP